jgi:hypothetical protein
LHLADIAARQVVGPGDSLVTQPMRPRSVLRAGPPAATFASETLPLSAELAAIAPAQARASVVLACSIVLHSRGPKGRKAMLASAAVAGCRASLLRRI